MFRSRSRGRPRAGGGTPAPTLDLNLAQTKSFPAGVTFTRSSTARYYDGVTVAKADENFVLYSQKYNEAAWVKTDATVANVGASLGPELIVNGDFATDSDWTKGTGWTIAGGVADKVAGTASLLSQDIGAVAGAYYQITFTMTRTAGVLEIRLGSSVNQIGYSTGGTRTITIPCGATDSVLYFSANAAFAGTIDNVSVKRSFAAPDRTSNVWQLTAGGANGTMTQAVSLPAGEYTFSVYLRRVTGVGDVDITTDSGGTWITRKPSSVWQRYSVTQTLAAGSKTPGIRIVTSGDVVEVWGAQLEQRATATAYVPTTTTAISTTLPVLMTASAGVPRFDHNPATGESLGYRAEGSKTNLLLRSEELQTAWGLSRILATTNTVVAPDGTLTGDVITSLVGASDSITQTVAVSAAVHTLSFFVKPMNATTVVNFGLQASGSFQASTGTIISGPGTLSGTGQFTLSNLSNTQWTRVAITTNAPITAGTTVVYIYPGSPGPAGAAAAIWGVQLETGPVATSYIKTEGSQVTRPADAAFIDGASFSSWYREEQGTFVVENNFDGGSSKNAFNRTVMQVDDGTNDNRLLVYNSNSKRDSVYIAVNNAQQVSIVNSLAESDEFIKVAFGFALNNVSAAYNGGSLLSDLSSLIPSGLIRLSIGRNHNSTGLELSGCIKLIRFYPFRLPNTQLQILSKQ